MKYEELIERPDVQENLDNVRAKYPGKRVRPIDTAAGYMICVNPSRPQWNQFLASIWSEDRVENAKSTEILLRSCVVYPDTKTLGEWLESYPGIASDPDTVLELRKLAGAAKEDASK